MRPLKPMLNATRRRNRKRTSDLKSTGEPCHLETWTQGSGGDVFAPCHGVIELYSQDTRGSYQLPRSSSDLPGGETQRGHIAGRKRSVRRSQVSKTRLQELVATAKTGLFEGQSPGTLPWSVGNLKYSAWGTEEV